VTDVFLEQRVPDADLGGEAMLTRLMFHVEHPDLFATEIETQNTGAPQQGTTTWIGSAHRTLCLYVNSLSLEPL
jgi:hypothetical protein